MRVGSQSGAPGPKCSVSLPGRTRSSTAPLVQPTPETGGMRPAYITARTEWKGSSCSVVVKNHPQGKLARVITERRHESATSAIPSRFFPGKRLCARGAPHPGVCQRNLGKVTQALPSALLSFLVPRFHKRRIPFNAVSISACQADFVYATTLSLFAFLSRRLAGSETLPVSC